MPTLSWIGKNAVVDHHHTVPFHLLRDVPALGCGEPGEGNLIVQGDNLVALKALLPYYAGEVKCIYIDPPYNTGNEDWAYNDNVNSPEIRSWLGKLVGKEGETLDRHDRWLCMMYPRLALLKRFLRRDGVIFASIDENELPNLLYLLDTLWGAKNRVCVFSWVRKKKGSHLDQHARKMTEFVACYAASIADLPPLVGEAAYADKLQPLVKRTNALKELRFPKGKVKTKLPDGDYQAGSRGKEGTGLEFLNPFVVSAGLVETELRVRGRFVWTQENLDRELELGTTAELSTKFGFNVLKWDQAEKTKRPSTLLSPENGIGTNEDASEELREIFQAEQGAVFPFPKPSSLISYLVGTVTEPGDLVLDSFGGSGTTAHAVLKLNAAAPERPPRRCILVEMDAAIAREVTVKRVSRVIQGYTNKKGEKVDGLGGSFRFCELGEPLYDEAGQIRPVVKFGDLARHVYFAETGEPLPRARVDHTPLLGVHRGRAICLLFNGILKDRSVEGGNALTHGSLAVLREALSGWRFERLIVYGTSRRLTPARLEREGITFKQIPYALHTS